jgi:hypothetical protein
MVVTWLSHLLGGLLSTLIAMGWAFIGFAVIAAAAGFLWRKPAGALRPVGGRAPP